MWDSALFLITAIMLEALVGMVKWCTGNDRAKGWSSHPFPCDTVQLYLFPWVDGLGSHLDGLTSSWEHVS